MSRLYLSYSFKLLEPAIIGHGSQLGNVLETLSFAPGTTMRGLIADLYLRKSPAYGAKGSYTSEFRRIFLSDATLYSPAYPLVDGLYRAFPMPLSVLGCKYYGENGHKARYRTMHGFRDHLYGDVPEECPHPGCHAPVEHKASFCYWAGPRFGFCSTDVEKRIRQHNRCAEEEEEKRLFSFESLAEKQCFYGEIAFSDEDSRKTVCDLLESATAPAIGKAKRRGYGAIEFQSPAPSDTSLREDWRVPLEGVPPSVFSITLFSDALLVDRSLNSCSTLDEHQLAYWMGLSSPEGLTVHHGLTGSFKSFFRAEPVLGFNHQRRMPLAVESAVRRGSAFTVTYEGKDDLGEALRRLERDGLGLRRNEGFGMIVVNHLIHGAPPEANRP